MSQASRVERMPAFSTLTPYYGEEVILSLDTLCSQTPDGVTTLEYLQTLFPQQWTALVERVKRTMPGVRVASVLFYSARGVSSLDIYRRSLLYFSSFFTL